MDIRSKVGVVNSGEDEDQYSLVPALWENTVRQLSTSESVEAGRSIAFAFAEEDLCRWLVDCDDMSNYSDEYKWKLHVDSMVYLVAAHCLQGVVTTIGPDFDSVALWVPPGGYIEGWWNIMRSGLWRLYFRLSKQGRQRYFHELIPVLHTIMAEVMGEREQDCYYLTYLGTKPNSRARGYAAALLNDMTIKADAEQRAIYLESSSLSNNDYYAKFGFRLKKRFSLGGVTEPVVLWAMVREPRPLVVAC